ncbi:MAG: thiamine pyrophosphate-dependent enzyme, partial [Actinomycetes bacterium]
NGWAVSTRSAVQTGGGLRRRLAAFGMPVVRVDGADVARVDVAAGRAVSRARNGGGPAVLLARCARLVGPFLGDPLVRVTSALGELTAEVRSLLVPARAKPGAPAAERLGALLAISRRAAIPAMQLARRGRDPLPRAGRRLPAEVATGLEARARAEVAQAEARALREAGVGA